MHARNVHHTVVPLAVHFASSAYEIDDAILKTDGGIVEGFPGSEVGRPAHNEDALGLWRAWRQVGLGQGSARKGEDGKEE